MLSVATTAFQNRESNYWPHKMKRTSESSRLACLPMSSYWASTSLVNDIASEMIYPLLPDLLKGIMAAGYGGDFARPGGDRGNRRGRFPAS